jgi:hypothetical protein
MMVDDRTVSEIIGQDRKRKRYDRIGRDWTGQDTKEKVISGQHMDG